MKTALPPIPVKRYFTIGEVAELCGVKPHVLRYWEQEFTQLRPMKRRGNRRYYQHHEVLMIRRIRDLLYDQGFTISGARNRLQELGQAEHEQHKSGDPFTEGIEADKAAPAGSGAAPRQADARCAVEAVLQLSLLRRELIEIRELLAVGHSIASGQPDHIG